MMKNKKLNTIVHSLSGKSRYKHLLDMIQTNSTLQQVAIQWFPIKIQTTFSMGNLIRKSKHTPIPAKVSVYKRPSKRMKQSQPIVQSPMPLYKEPTNHSNVSTLYKMCEYNVGVKLFNHSQTIQLVGDETLFIGFSILIYDTFLSMNDSKKRECMKNIKYKLSVDLDKKDLYKKYNYSTKRFKKSTLQADLMDNKCLKTDSFHRYLGDYFDLNFIIKRADTFEFLNEYSKNRYSILIFGVDDDYYIQYNINGHSFVDNDYTKEFNKIQNRNLYNKKTRTDLQTIATNHDINIMKKGKSGFIKKTKKELIEELVHMD